MACETMTASCYSTTATPFHGEVALPYLQTLVRVAEQVGIDSELIDKVLTGAHLAWDSPSVSVEQYIAVMKFGVDRCSDFGLRVGKAVTPGTYPVLGMTLLSCQSLRQVLEQVVRYECLNHDLGTSRLKLGKDESLYTWTGNPFYLPDYCDVYSFHVVVSVFAGIQTFAPWLINRDIPFEQISFMAPAPKDVAVFKAYFKTDIQFDQPINSIRVKSNILDWPVLNGDSASFDVLTSHAETLLHSRDDQQELIWKLKSILPEALRRQTFRIEEVSNELSMSVRTLQRKLKESGYGYKQLLDEVRRQLAEFYLTDTVLSMNEIAFLIGYQEQSSFNHAFRGWNGESPTSFRGKRSAKKEILQRTQIINATAK